MKRLAALIVGCSVLLTPARVPGERAGAPKGPPVKPPCQIAVHADRVVHPRFGGVGFHVFHHVFPSSKAHLEEVLAKRWRELNPSFARLNDKWSWDRETLDEVAEHLLRLKATGTEVYLTTWGPKDTAAGAERADYARRVVDNLEYLVRKKGATNVRTYCMTNELSLGGWGKLRGDLPKFKDYHRELFDELKARKLDIRLLATDASPVQRWDTIDWAARNMDEITGVYGGHHYFNRHDPKSLTFYAWFLSKVTWGAGIARQRGKDFIVGEFGCKQDGRVIAGRKMDRCVYWGSPLEPLVGIQLAEAVIAAVNGGAYAVGNWTFTDFPDPPPEQKYMNKWGTFKWSGTNYATRPHYYAYGLLTKFFRGPATALKTTCADDLVRVAAVRHHGKKTFSIAAVNRRSRAAAVTVALDGAAAGTAAFRKYVYDPKNVPSHPFGDLQPPAGKLAVTAGRLTDTLAATSLTVYTTAYDDEPPAPVRGLRVAAASAGRRRLTWRAGSEADLCYYRVYRSKQPAFEPSPVARIGSTVATDFLDESAGADTKWHYKVIAVDQSGNAGPPGAAAAP